MAWPIILCVVVFDVVAVAIDKLVVFVCLVTALDVVFTAFIVLVDVVFVIVLAVDANLRASVVEGIF